MPTDLDLSKLSQSQAEADARKFEKVSSEISKVVVGQPEMIRSMLIGLLTGGHVLIEGLPGLAKTLSIKTLAQALELRFQRIQFTPDLLPSDLIGTMIYREQTGEFIPKKGPLFSNIVLADEINRAPAKVQSALLEAMAERQVTIGETTFPLAEPFLVLATQNPIEQEGTYPLPEAQLDRFQFKLVVKYPTRSEEMAILERLGGGESPRAETVMTAQELLSIRQDVPKIHMDPQVQDYIVRLVVGTRPNSELSEQEGNLAALKQLRSRLRIGASPRATLFLAISARASALLDGRHYVVPDDVKSVARDVLRHRILLTFEALANQVSPDDIVETLLENVSAP